MVHVNITGMLQNSTSNRYSHMSLEIMIHYYIIHLKWYHQHLSMTARFDLRSGHVEFVAEKVGLGQAFTQCFMNIFSNLK
jgi:hypothetical protein